MSFTAGGDVPAAMPSARPRGFAVRVLEVSELHQVLGSRRVLEGISLDVRAGEVVALLGPNGSGKTTLLRSVAGLLPVPPGSVRLDASPLEHLAPRERALRIAYLPQLRVIPAGFDVRQLVEMGRYPHGGEGAASRRQAVRRALDSVVVGELAERSLDTLSGGELQRAFIASVVAQEAMLVLLDEPTVFLDPGGAAEIQRVLVELAGAGYAMLLATHDLDFARRSATRAVGIRAGRIVFDGPPAAVLTSDALARLYDARREGEAVRPSPVGVGDGRMSDGERRDAPPASGPQVHARGSLAATPEPEREGRSSNVRKLAVLTGACLAVLLAAPWIGAPTAAASSSRGDVDPAAFILWHLRVPRVLLAAQAGAALAVAGATFQSLFRNPLATPYTLGVASGAACGAVATLTAGLVLPLFGTSTLVFGALAGALAITAAVYVLGRRRYGLPTETLLLAGVTLSFFFSAFILLLQYFADFTETFRILRWLMGEVRILGYRSFGILTPLVLLGLGAVLMHRTELNLLLTGEELAAARGVRVESVKRALFAGSSLMVAAVVALCGPIGFVGLIVPHALRAILGSDHRLLIPACIPAGAAFLVLCDTVARLVLAPAELPVGVVTALLGGPFFLAILLRRRATVGG